MVSTSDFESTEAAPPSRVAGLRQALIERIGELRAGGVSKLPAERELMRSLATTRITLRATLGQLENEGLIYRESRRGWFVAPPRLRYDLLAGIPFPEMVTSQQRRVATEVRSAARVAAPANIAGRLGLANGAPVIRIVRVRSVDGRRVVYVEHHLRPDCFPGILDFDLEAQSLTALYRHEYAIRIVEVTFELGSTVFGGPAGEALRVAPGAPAQRITRINRDQHGRVVDCDDEYWRHDAIELRLRAVPEPP
ncbi:UTRA domain-containing protein [Salinicola aestuarinus]|uniref:UTRA domain-containing protein n=1 Tax=Salinicola aestuarinus TaxID=1949082 RepID=UPI000DA2090D|nr:UTRA domain-containing protein [Salinicola aestuarinus]